MTQPAFTQEQLQYLEAVFGLKPIQETLPVRDGVVTKETKVWWRGAAGPELVHANDKNHWGNIKRYPEIYQLKKPDFKVTYRD